MKFSVVIPSGNPANLVSCVRALLAAEPDLSPQEIIGKYVVVGRKTGRDWKLATDIWNTNK